MPPDLYNPYKPDKDDWWENQCSKYGEDPIPQKPPKKIRLPFKKVTPLNPLETKEEGK